MVFYAVSIQLLSEKATVTTVNNDIIVCQWITVSYEYASLSVCL